MKKPIQMRELSLTQNVIRAYLEENHPECIITVATDYRVVIRNIRDNLTLGHFVTRNATTSEIEGLLKLITHMIQTSSYEEYKTNNSIRGDQYGVV